MKDGREGMNKILRDKIKSERRDRKGRKRLGERGERGGGGDINLDIYLLYLPERERMRHRKLRKRGKR